MDLRACAETDGKSAATDTLGDKTGKSSEGKSASEDIFFQGDAVIAQKFIFQRERKMDLAAVQMTGKLIIVRKVFLSGIVRKRIDIIRVMDKKKAESRIV